MSSVDNRIVRMVMDNSKFNAAAASTMTSLRKLSDSLKFADGMKGLDGLAGKVRGVDMSGLASGVDTVTSKFSALDIVGVTALVNITNSAINAGKNLVKSLTLDPVMDGFREYEIKMEAIQTIMTNTASKGTSLQNINDALAELNEYSDKTIYNFAQMTDNIGKATAAGVGLEDSVAFVKGMSNVAAGFGVNAQAMAGATQQMTQALASGTVRLQDWVSMENRGMGGQMLQDELYATAESMGVYVDKSVPFRYTLEQNWLSSDIFIETMKRMGNDENLTKAATNVTSLTKLVDTMKESVGSGWAVTWEHIFGDKEESTALFTSISQGFANISGAMADYRNESLKAWKAEGGRTAILNGLKNIMESIGKIIGPIASAFKKIFDPWNSDRLVSLSKGFESFTEKLKISDEASSAIGRTFEGLFSIVKLLLSPLKLVGKAFEWIVIIAKPIIGAIMKITGALGGVATKGTEAMESSTLFGKALDWITRRAEDVAWILEKVFSDIEWVFKYAYEKGSVYVEKFGNKFSELVGIGKEKISKAAEYVREWIEVHKPVEKAGEYVKIALETIEKAIKSFVNFCSTSIGKIRDFFDSIVQKVKESDIQAIDLVNVGLFATAIIGIKKFLGFVKGFFGGFDNVKDGVLGVLDSVKDTLEAYQKDIKADMLKKVAISIAILTGSLFVLSKIDPERLIPASIAMVSCLTALLTTMKILEKIDDKTLKESIGTMALMVGIGVSLMMVGSALRKLAELDFLQISQGILGMSGVVLVMWALLEIIDKVEIPKGVGTDLIKIGVTIGLFALSLKFLSTLDIPSMMKGLTGLMGIVLVLSLFLQSIDKLTLTNPGKGLIPIATSMIILAGALALFGNMNIGTLLQGYAVLVASLIAFSGFANSMRGLTSNMATIGFGILLISNALIVLAGAVALFGNMNFGTLAFGLGSVAIVMGIFAVALKAMPRNTAAIGLGLLLLSVGLNAVALSIGLLGMMDLTTILKGLVGLAGILGVLGLAATVFSPLAMPMLLFAAAVAALGVAAGLAGGGLMILSAGFTTFSGSLVLIGGSIMAMLAMLAVAVPVMAASIALAIVSFITVIGSNAKALGIAMTKLLGALLDTIIANIPKAIEAVSLFITEILNAIVKMAPVIEETLSTLVTQLREFLVTLILNILVALEETVPALLNALVVILRAALEAVRVLIPEIVAVVMEVIVAILYTLSQNLPMIADAIIQFLVQLVVTILDNLAQAIPQIASKIVDIITAIVTSIGDGIPRVVEAIFDLVINLINGLANAVSTKMPQVREAIKTLIKAILTEFKNCIKDMVSVGGDIINGVVKGIKGGITAIKDAAMNVARSALDAAKDFLGIHSPSREFAKLGKWSSIGMANGISDYGDEVSKEATGVADGALSGMRAAMAGVSDLMNSDLDNQPVIKPILDLSEIQNGVNSVDGLMSDTYSMKASMQTARTVNTNNPLNSVQSQQLGVAQPNTNTITNTFNITGTNANEIANEVSRIIQQQVERRDVVWA